MTDMSSSEDMSWMDDLFDLEPRKEDEGEAAL